MYIHKYIHMYIYIYTLVLYICLSICLSIDFPGPLSQQFAAKLPAACSHRHRDGILPFHWEGRTMVF